MVKLIFDSNPEVIARATELVIVARQAYQTPPENPYKLLTDLARQKFPSLSLFDIRRVVGEALDILVSEQDWPDPIESFAEVAVIARRMENG